MLDYSGVSTTNVTPLPFTKHRRTSSQLTQRTRFSSMRKNKDTIALIDKDLGELRSAFGQSTSKVNNDDPYTQSTILASDGLYPHLRNHKE